MVRSVLLVLLLLAAPAMAQEAPSSDDSTAAPSGDPSATAESGNESAAPSEAEEQAAAEGEARTFEPRCELVDWWGPARPTYIVVDPDRCFIPAEVRRIVPVIV